MAAFITVSMDTVNKQVQLLRRCAVDHVRPRPRHQIIPSFRLTSLAVTSSRINVMFHLINRNSVNGYICKRKNGDLAGCGAVQYAKINWRKPGSPTVENGGIVSVTSFVIDLAFVPIPILVPIY